MFFVCVERDSQVIYKNKIERNICRIGRSPFSDVFLDFPFISYEHLIIIEVLGNYFLIDKGLNNVFVNGHIISKNVPVILKEDKRIKIGDVIINILPSTIVERRDTLLLFENMQKGPLEKDIILISNSNEVISAFSDEEFDLERLMKNNNVSEILKNNVLRILKISKKKQVKFVILIKGSRYFNHIINRKGKRVFSGFDFIILIFILVILLLSLLFIHLFL